MIKSFNKNIKINSINYRLVNSNVFLSPMNGSITELAKNLILCGVNITICDNSIITNQDLD